jgi:hypothetical protein
MAVAIPYGKQAEGSYRMDPVDEDWGVLHIDEEAAEAQRQAQRKAEIRKENLSLCRTIMIFLVYLGVFTIAMFLESSDSSSRFADHIRNMMIPGGHNHHAKMALDRIGDTRDMYSFLEQVFVPALWENNTDTNLAQKESMYLHPVDVSNRMIGAARIRQVRVQSEAGCQVDPMFIDYMINCYPVFTPGGLMGASNEATDAFGPDMKYTYQDDPLGTGYSGSMGVYPAGGYMAYLSTNRTTALLAIDMLRTENFFGLNTRAVFVDFLVWNSNLGVYSVCRIAVEFGPTGTVTSYLEVSILSEQMLTLAGHGNLKDWFAFLFVIGVMGFVTWFMVEEIQEIVSQRLDYFTDGWNVLDWVNMLLLLFAFILRILVFTDENNKGIGIPQLDNKDAFPSVRGLASRAETVRLLHSFNAVLLWGKCTKYLKHLPIVKVLVKTIWNAFSLFVPLMTMFTIALVGFTMAYNIGFGDKIQELTTFTRAIVYLSRSFLRDVKMLPVYYITPIFGAFLILLFYVMLVLVGVQVLFAIVTDAMYRNKHHPPEDDPEHKDEPLEEVLRELKKHGAKMMKMCCPWFYRKFIKKPMSKEERAEMIRLAREGQEEKLALKDHMKDAAMSESSYSMSTEPRERIFTTAEIMLAIQHMSGRVLSEVQEVGIEIRSELHDVCERVAQMQMAVEELSWRAELVKREQETVM